MTRIYLYYYKPDILTSSKLELIKSKSDDFIETEYIELITDNGYYIFENNKICKYNLLEDENEAEQINVDILINEINYNIDLVIEKFAYIKSNNNSCQLPFNSINRYIIKKEYKIGEISLIIEGNNIAGAYVPNNFYFFIKDETHLNLTLLREFLMLLF
jgi:hypothetical protein